MSGFFELEGLAARADSARFGGKALRLAQLLELGAPVPAGIVVPAGEFDRAALEARCAELGPMLVVRSSSASEDAISGAAAGVFDSFAGVAPKDVADHIEAVRASALAAPARAYAEARGSEFPAPMAVLIQRQVEGPWSGTLYTRESADSDRWLLETVTAAGVETDVVDPNHDLGGVAGMLRAWVPKIESVVGGPADIEWVVQDESIAIVQARPLVRFARAPRPRPSEDVFAFSADDPDVWRLDVGHNPLPLSAAQAGLVELFVSELGSRLATAEGYLYEAAASAPPFEGADLEALFFADIAPSLEAKLSPVEEAAPDLEAALEVFVDVGRAYQTLAPVLSAAKKRAGGPASFGLGTAMLESIAADSSFSEAARQFASALADGGAHAYWAPYSNRWDVAAPCHAEDPEALDELVSRLADRQPRSGGSVEQRLVHAVAELDDRFFYRAQRVVRRAILALPGEMPNRFDLALDELRRWGMRGEPEPGAAERAAANRHRREQAAELSMPLAVRGGRPLAEARVDEHSVLRGAGSGGRVRGPVSLDSEPNCVHVAQDLTPGEILAARTAVAIIVERGSLLGHAAALARELEVPIITGVERATKILRPGEPVWLDADRGLIVRASRREA